MELIEDALAYEPDSGVFRWRTGKCAGNIAGTVRRDGYVKITIGGSRRGKQYLAHRLAWRFFYGAFPEGEIDHEDRNPTNNRIGNLRLATSAQNKVNRRINRNNTSGFTGVTLHKPGAWRARLGIGYRGAHVGLYSTKEEAAEARDIAARATYGDFIPEVGHR